MTLEVTLDQVLDDWVESHGKTVTPGELERIMTMVLTHVSSNQAALVLLRLLVNESTQGGRLAAVAQLKEDEFDALGVALDEMSGRWES